MTATSLVVLLNRTMDGVWCVRGTRVTLGTLMAAYREGYSAEEIVQQYPGLPLADVYAVISYVLQHPDEIAAYLQQQEIERLAVQQENEMRFPPAGIRERLVAR